MALISSTSLLPMAQASYMPEAGRRSYAEGESVPLYVRQLTSTQTLIPLDYYQQGAFCQPLDGPVRQVEENFGAQLQGYRTETVPYTLEMKKDKYCQQVCLVDLGTGTAAADKKRLQLEHLIRHDYHGNWLLDHLPGASILEDDDKITTRYWQGIPIGASDYDYYFGAGSRYQHDNRNRKDLNGTLYLFNHLNFEIMYNQVPRKKKKKKGGDDPPAAYRILRFQIRPFSIHHEIELDDNDADDNNDPSGQVRIVNPIASCIPDNQNRPVTRLGEDHHTTWEMVTEQGRKPQTLQGKVLFTYDVVWSEHKFVKWSDRWNIYLNMDFAVPARVHWMSIANSVAACVILVGILVASIVRCLRKERNMYKKLDTHEEGEDGTEYGDPSSQQPAARPAVAGWIAIREQVFLPPLFYPTWLAVWCATGAQLLAACFVTVLLAAMGFMSSVREGRLLRGVLLCYAFAGPVGGLVAERLVQAFGLQNTVGWKRVAMLTALVFPGLVFGVFLVINTMEWSMGSTKSVSSHVLIILLVLWLGVSAPLVGLGAYWGHDKLDRIDFPFVSATTTKVAAEVGGGGGGSERRPLPPPRRWCARICLVLIRFFFLDVLTFGCLFVELYYVLSCTWMGYYYTTYGFLLLSLLVGIATSAFTAVIVTYFRFRREDYRWWWSSVTTAGAIGGYLFLYSFVYFPQLYTKSGAAAVIYFAYMTLVSLGLACMFGFVGLAASFFFSKHIYSSLEQNRPDLDMDNEEEGDASCPSQEMTKVTTSTREG